MVETLFLKQKGGRSP